MEKTEKKTIKLNIVTLSEYYKIDCVAAAGK